MIAVASALAAWWQIWFPYDSARQPLPAQPSQHIEQSALIAPSEPEKASLPNNATPAEAKPKVPAPKLPQEPPSPTTAKPQ